MPNSKADNAKPATVAGEPAADAKSRARAGRRASADNPAPRNEITITRRGLGVSFSLAVTILAGAMVCLAARMSGIEASVRDLRADLGDEFGGLRQEMRAEFSGLRQELRAVMREEIGGLRAETGSLRAEMDGLRAEIHELGVLIRARYAPDEPGAPDAGAE